MIDQLNSENNAMFKIWASREKQICTVLKNIPILFESIKWIVGKELITSNILELSKKMDIPVILTTRFGDIDHPLGCVSLNTMA